MRTLPFLALLLAGCPASVTAEGIDAGFGPGFSAVWAHEIYGKESSDVVVLSNIGDVCTLEKDFLAASQDFSDAAVDVLSSNYCKNLEDPLAAYVAAAQKMYPKGANYVSLSTGDNLETGEFSLGKEAAGQVMAVTDDVYADTMDEFDADGDVTDGCGLGTDWQSGEGTDNWNLTDGKLKITSLSDEATAVGSVDGSMETDKGKDDGAFTAEFSATYCEIDLTESGD